MQSRNSSRQHRRRPQPPAHAVDYLTSAHIQAIEDAAGNLRDALLVRMLFRTGCRISEALAITPADFNFSRNTITINHLKKRTLLKCPGCGARLARADKACSQCAQLVSKAIQEQQEQHSRRTILVDFSTISMMREYIAHGSPDAKTRLLFPISRNWAQAILLRLARKARVPPVIVNGNLHHVSPHRMRDAHATAFVLSMAKDGKGDDAFRLLQEQLGHSSINTTFKYRKLGATERREAYDRVFGEGERDAQN